MLGGLTSAVIIGSAIGGLITGLIFRHPVNTSLAISAGYGWYSLSGILLKNLASAEIGAIAFMSNVFREMMAFVLIPILAIRVNHLTSIAPLVPHLWIRHCLSYRGQPHQILQWLHS